MPEVNITLGFGWADLVLSVLTFGAVVVFVMVYKLRHWLYRCTCIFTVDDIPYNWVPRYKLFYYPRFKHARPQCCKKHPSPTLPKARTR